ncbi:M20 family metallopeptidase [Oceanobacillus salinisoli]|uniref:M20 family metallopeptidase n=1 Tax=Oceanobacillus salinisoli TaxID=2678611 RepID=UPI0012E1C3A4|nr:M20 family metallopeptidase [Oceanobacillus salinisoli]
MKTLNYLKFHQQEILDDLEKLVKHDSPSLHKEMVDECGQFLKQLITERLKVEIIEYPNTNSGNHIKFEFGEGDEQILILTHYDTVWEKGALDFKIEGERAYGPGILDMKGGIIQGFWALKAIKDLQLTPNKKVVYLLTSDEEVFSPTSRKLIEDEAKKSEVVLVLEPAAESGALKVARKGAAKFRLRAKGISSHAGHAPNINASAIHEIARQIIYLETLADFDQGTSINVGVIKGGELSNVVSDYAEAEIDIRFSKESEGVRVEKELFNLRPKLKQTKIEVTGGINRPPMEQSKEAVKLFKMAQEVANDLGFKITGESVGGISDGNFTAALGIPTLDGLGSVGEGPHAIHEHIIIDEIPKRTALLADFIVKL